jgi:hypothetical protein
MPAAKAVKQEGWIDHAERAADKRYLPGRNVGPKLPERKNPLAGTEPKKKPLNRAKRYMPDIKRATDGEFGNMLTSYWGADQLERARKRLDKRLDEDTSKLTESQLEQRASQIGQLQEDIEKLEELAKARSECLARARDWVIEAFLRADGGDHNYRIDPEEWEDDITDLFQALVSVGLGPFNPVCNKHVEARYRGKLNGDDVDKLILWLHLELIEAAIEQLKTVRVISQFDGDWCLSVCAADKVRKKRPQQVIVPRRARAA